MKTSKNYGFYLPSRDDDDIVDINQISENFGIIDTELSEVIKGKGVDQVYNAESPNPQSGKAVAGALTKYISLDSNTEFIFDGGDASSNIDVDFVIDTEMSSSSENAVSNKVIKLYVDTEVEKLEEEINEKIGNNVDYVIEQNTSGIWTYRKWKSGIAECWCYITKNLSAFNEMGNNHWYKPFGDIAFPDGLFNAIPVVNVTLSNDSAGGLGQGSLVLQKSNPTQDSTGLVYALLSSSSAPTGEVPCGASFDVKGRWE